MKRALSPPPPLYSPFPLSFFFPLSSTKKKIKVLGPPSFFGRDQVKKPVWLIPPSDYPSIFLLRGREKREERPLLLLESGAGVELKSH